MKFKKLLNCSLAMALVFGTASFLTGCNKDDGSSKTEESKQYQIYKLAVDAGATDLSYEDWIVSIKGAKGNDGVTPHIGNNGNWWIGTTDTGVKAQGAAGQNGAAGADGEDGAAGNGIASIAKTATNGNVDTYTITFTDNTVAPVTFNVTNGTNGTNGVSVTAATINGTGNLILTLTGPNGTTTLDAGKVTGATGEAGRGIEGVEKTTEGNVDTYTITYTDATTYSFSVTNGTTWLTGIGDPDSAEGLNPKEGDFYFDKVGNNIWTYSDSQWVLDVDLEDDVLPLTLKDDVEYTGNIMGKEFSFTLETEQGIQDVKELYIDGVDGNCETMVLSYEIKNNVIELVVDISGFPGASEPTSTQYLVLDENDDTRLVTYVSDEDREYIKGSYSDNNNKYLTVASSTALYYDGSNRIKGSYVVIGADNGTYDLSITTEEGKIIEVYIDAFNRQFNVTAEKIAKDKWDGTSTYVPQAVNNVIKITKAEQLAALAESVNEGNTYEGITIKLAADLDLSNLEWTPIGYGGGSDVYGTVDTNSAVFSGTFDGQNHTISNLKITTYIGGAANEFAATGVGLFGAALKATIKNFAIENAVVTGNHFVAAAVGTARGTTIDSVSVVNATISCNYLDEDESGDKAGVIVGYIGILTTAGSDVVNCEVENSTVNAARDAGQVIGCLSIDTLYGMPQTIVNQSNNEATEVEVIDNNGIQNAENNDNIKEGIVGRINDPSNALQ